MGPSFIFVMRVNVARVPMERNKINMVRRALDHRVIKFLISCPSPISADLDRRISFFHGLRIGLDHLHVFLAGHVGLIPISISLIA